MGFMPAGWHLAELRDLLCEWDPIGLMPALPEDEYDCVMDPLIALLERGESPERIVQFLEEELRDHFGLSPTRGSLPTRTRVLATKAIAWYARAR